MVIPWERTSHPSLDNMDSTMQVSNRILILLLVLGGVQSRERTISSTMEAIWKGDLVSPQECFSESWLGNVSSEIIGVDISKHSTRCPDGIFNEELWAMNAVEIDVPMDVVLAIKADYEKDILANLGYSTEDICCYKPYKEETWRQDEENSDIAWYTERNLKTYQKYVDHIDKTGIKEYFKGSWIDADEVIVYGWQFITRGNSIEHFWHLDWPTKCHTQVMTVLIPLQNDNNINLVYYDWDDKVRKYYYKMGKAMGFAGGFWHATDTGKSETPEAVMSIYIGGKDRLMWERWKHSMADEHPFYMHPYKGFIRNEKFCKKDSCQPMKGEGPKAQTDDEDDEDECPDPWEEDDKLWYEPYNLEDYADDFGWEADE